MSVDGPPDEHLLDAARYMIGGLRETFLREQLRMLAEEYQRRSKPIVDELVRIEAAKPRPPIIIERFINR